MDLNYYRKAAGLPLVESDASPEHIKSEKALFETCIGHCDKIIAMCEARLQQKDLSDEHKKQYTELCKCTKEHVALLRKHLASYK